MSISNFYASWTKSQKVACINSNFLCAYILYWAASTFEREMRERAAMEFGSDTFFFGVNRTAGPKLQQQRAGGWESDTHLGCELPCCAAHARETHNCCPAGTADTKERTKGESCDVNRPMGVACIGGGVMPLCTRSARSGRRNLRRHPAPSAWPPPPAST